MHNRRRKSRSSSRTNNGASIAILNILNFFSLTPFSYFLTKHTRYILSKSRNQQYFIAKALRLVYKDRRFAISLKARRGTVRIHEEEDLLLKKEEKSF